MNKNLESEYQNMIRAEVPDIWDKIEAKIDAQEAQKKVVPFTKKASRWKYYVIPAAAALLCVAIAVPVMLNTGGGKNASPTAAPAADYAPAAADGAATSSLAYEAEDAYYYAETAESAEMTDNAVDMINESDVRGASDNKDKTATYNMNLGVDPGVQAITAGEAVGAAEENDADEVESVDDEEYDGGTVFTMITGGGIPRDLIEKAVNTLGLKIREYDPEKNLYRIVSEYELNEDMIKDIIEKLKDSGFIKDIFLGE